MDKDYLDELLKKYAAGTCTEQERAAVENWYTSYDNRHDPQHGPSLTDKQYDRLYANVVNRLKKEGEWPSERSSAGLSAAIMRWAVAASILLTAGTVYYLYHSAYSGQKSEQAVVHKNPVRFKNDIVTGGNRAVLTLADGGRVVLDSIANGKVATQGSAQVIKLDQGQLSYQSTSHSSGINFYNTLSTPGGAKYAVVLPDGSKAWLNASSSLRFPTAFNSKERIVELAGEAYFEIAPLYAINGAEKGEKNKIPFIVKIVGRHGSGGQVEVLGTHFNVMAYADEPAVKTTLVEGKVKVSRDSVSRILTPGLQASFLDNAAGITISDVDTEEAVAWRNNIFWFTNADIETVMRQIERMYGVEVIFEGQVLKKFNGTIPGNMGAIKVLNILEMTGGVHFRIDGHKITVLP